MFVARVKTTALEPEKDAVLLINGGPGASSVALYGDLERALSPLARQRDVVMVDQRGTGDSHPLNCEAESLTLPDRETIGATVAACLASLNHDPRSFSTSVAVADLEAIRQQLGYTRWTIYGVSYGTRVAIHYARRFPERTRALVLDGVLPPGQGAGG